MNSEHYQEHIDVLNHRAQQILTREGLQGLVIHSGQPHRQFLDDMNYPFKVNPHFKAWVPLLNLPNSWLIINGTDKPTLVFYRPSDFWHKVSDVPTDDWTASVNIKILTKVDKIAELLPANIQQWAYVGEHLDVAEVLGFKHRNPDGVMNYLHFHRVEKTAYELDCLRAANRLAVLGHHAAKEAFFAGASEYGVQQAYLQATGQLENDMPYGNIIALNENAAILHYTDLTYEAPSAHRSLLIDAGAQVRGYAADITRTYAFEHNDFYHLIQDMDTLQCKIIAQMKPGVRYVDLHVQTHQLLAQVLLDHQLASGDVDSLIESGVTRTFFPHGLGHMLGLQVHDVGGFMHDERGTHMAPPPAHPFLRCTRTLAANQVLTVEPGLYIIDSLLADLADTPAKQLINWSRVDAFRPFGGIRIEDNVIIHSDRTENMTRESGLID
ncbi:Xaa-Pro dipeptidase [Shewanella sp. NIFS-20-20]|uniref:Xaa-Pro dipeptidase n=1 Tax=Shewanella sp. NIFS-20-20 TaxID=2853806 RepID=UPI001C48B50A|nr:Xaa-Pro dipeptidase [Shewanella sp. NIFS-20-20]MBV7315574.1 Xaa-Pro dipeptidase [Shewanella sp. NIFS-20-20]